MTKKTIRHPWLVVLSLLLPLSPIRAEEPALRDLLRDALYTEEVARDPEKAAKQYEELLSRHAEQKQFAASALFRLAEVRRKQDRKDDAIQLYQRLLAEFPNAETETKLARENLAALGGKPLETKGPATDAESVEIARLEGLAKSAPDLLLDPATLNGAVEKGWGKVVQYLLATGSRPFAGDALRTAAEKGYLEIVKHLTAGDAPVPERAGSAAIEAAILNNRATVLEFLLQRGVKPGTMPKSGASAISCALLNGKQQSAEILLKHGVDLDATSGNPDPLARSEGTALQRVIAEGKFDAANWLLDKGAKPDIPSHGVGITPLHEAVLQSSDGSLALMQRLLEAGADPNRRTANREILDFTRSFLQNATPLALAVQTAPNSTEKVRLLLKYGADPKQDKQLLKLLVEGRNQMECMECLKLLVDAGARPHEEWMRKQFEGARDNVRQFLMDAFAIPALANESEIQLVINDQSDLVTREIAVRSGDSAPPDLGTWLLANHQNYRWPISDPKHYQWLIWRKGEAGALSKQELDFSGNAPLPQLKWGDVIEYRITRTSGFTWRGSLPIETLWPLCKRIAFPITFEIDGTSREIVVRGDRVIFDPTKNEVPLRNLQQVVEFLWPLAVTQLMEPAPTIHVTRKGWPDVRLSYGSNEAQKFKLEAEDRVKLQIPDPVRDNLTKARRMVVTLKLEGYPLARHFGTVSDGKLVEASIPTLIQALVESQGAPWDSWMSLAGTKTLDAKVLADDYGVFYGACLLPHPDFSQIRIRRLHENGGEKVIEVNLAKIIAASTDQTTPEEARKADVPLQAGDIVEISPIKDRLGEPWKGIDPKEERFFAKALSGRVRVTDKDGNMTVRDLVFRAPCFIETECGWLPVPPETGMPSLRGGWLTRGVSQMTITRGDQQSGVQDSSRLFLRDGDEVRTSNEGPPPQPGQSRQSRPRVIPPPSR